jgi:branched-chain amino acid transport system substrate-binding protein
MSRIKWFRLLALCGALAMIAVACGGGDDEGESGGGDGTASCTWKIGTMGALSGDYATLGVPIFEGIQYAVDEANDAGEVPCTLEIRREDSQGSSDQAPPLAQSIVQDTEVVGCVCPYFSGETLAVGDTFKEANVLMTGTGTSEDIDDQNFGVWFRSVASDGVQAPAAATYIEEVLQPERVAVVHDNQDYSKGLAEGVAEELGDLVTGISTIDPGEDDYSAAIAEVNEAEPDVVYYGGYNPEAGQLLGQLREAGVEADYVSDDGAKDPSFGQVPGPEAAGAVVTCPCGDPAKIPGAEEFVQGMSAEYGQDAPGTFAADMYDVTTFIIDALSELNGDEPIEEVRQHVIDYFENAEELQGIAKTYTWEDNGEFVADPLEDIWIYEWSTEEKNFVSVGPASEVTGG